MDFKPAMPERYAVGKVGSQDSSHSEYFVLNITDDPIAREAMAYLGRQYAHANKNQLAKECFDLLDSTLPVFTEVMERRQPKKKGSGKKDKGAHP